VGRCVRLAVDSCKRFLDNALLEAEKTYHAPSTPERQSTVIEEAKAVAAEISSLWEEILPLALLCTEATLLNPLLSRLEKAQDNVAARAGSVRLFVWAFHPLLSVIHSPVTGLWGTRSHK
jgi:hypothetical protein